MSPYTPKTQVRRGTITPFFLMALVVLVAAFAVAIDYSFLTETRQEMRNTTDAAALAAADVFVDDAVLLNDPAVLQNLQALSRLEALKYGQLNRVAGQPLVFDANLNNFADGDILFGTIDNPAVKVFVPAQSTSAPVNAVRIIGRRTKARGNPAGTLASRAFGLTSVDMVANSTALLDHHVYGFRPNTSRPLPLAPIALLSDPSGVNPQSWEFNVEEENGPLTGNSLLHGIDITLSQNGSVLSIGSTVDAAHLGNQLLNGLTPVDLANLGGQVVLDTTNELDVTGPPIGLNPSDLATALQALQASATQRVFPLYSSYNAPTNEVTLSGFVAARVVSVQPMNGGLTFRLQPTVLAVPAALTSAVPRGPGNTVLTNPYVVKLRLVE